MLVKHADSKIPTQINLSDLLDRSDWVSGLLRPLQRLNDETQERFQKIMGNIEDDEFVFIQVGSSDEEENGAIRTKFIKQIQSEEAQHFKDIKWIYSEPGQLEKYGLEETPGSVYLVYKNSEMLKIHSNGKLNIGGADQEVIPINIANSNSVKNTAKRSSNQASTPEVNLLKQAGVEFYKNNATASNLLPPQRTPYVLEVAYDANEFNSAKLLTVKSALKAVRLKLEEEEGAADKLTIILRRKNFKLSEGRHMSVIFRENDKISKRLEYLFSTKTKYGSAKLLSETPEVATDKAFEYQLPEYIPFSAEGLVEFVKLGLAGKLKDRILSEEMPKYERYSREVTGDSFQKTVRENNMAQVMFLHSAFCGSCKKFTPLYEKLSRDNIAKGLKLLGYEAIFNRMDKDKNDLPSTERQYDSTPVFLLWRGDKQNVFQYRSGFLTEESLLDFLSVSGQFHIIPEKDLASMVSRAGVLNK